MIYSNKTIIILIIIGFISLQGCQQERKAQSKILTMTFTINTDLLGDSLFLKDIGLSLRAPKNWLRLPDSLQTIIESRLSALTGKDTNASFQKLHILNIYTLPNNEASMILSGVEFPKHDSTDTLRLQRYKKNIKEQVSNADLGIADFIANGIPMTQCLIRTPQNTTFKLLYKAKNTFIQCDYIISTNVFQREIRAVESSIGSTQLH